MAAFRSIPAEANLLFKSVVVVALCLSQSPDFEVMGTDRLMEILKELRRVDDEVLTADLVREIANRARVDNADVLTSDNLAPNLASALAATLLP